MRYTVAQAARVAGITTQTIQNWIRNGTLVALREGRWYIAHDDLMARVGWKWKQKPPP